MHTLTDMVGHTIVQATGVDPLAWGGNVEYSTIRLTLDNGLQVRFELLAGEGGLVVAWC